MELECPHCHQPTESLKQYRCLRWCLFLLAGAVWQAEVVVACPACMRRHLWKRSLVNLLPANLVWVVGILPWTVILTILSTRPGHSGTIVQALENPPPSPLPDSPFVTRRNLEVRDELAWDRVFTILAWFLFSVPILGLVFALLAWFLSRRSNTWTRVGSRMALLAAFVAHVGWLALFVAIGAGLL